jgi:hypothetical protein
LKVETVRKCKEMRENLAKVGDALLIAACSHRNSDPVGVAKLRVFAFAMARAGDELRDLALAEAKAVERE